MPDDLAVLALEIGARDYLSEFDARYAARAYRLARRRYPQTPMLIAISGYDQDPRELWEICETRDYIRRWATLAGLTDWRRVIKLPWLDNMVPGILQLVGAFAADSPIKVTTMRRN